MLIDNYVIYHILQQLYFIISAVFVQYGENEQSFRERQWPTYSALETRSKTEAWL